MLRDMGKWLLVPWLPSHPSHLLTAPVGLQVFHCHFNSNFFPLFLEHLLSDHISLSTGSFLLGEWVSQAGWKDRGLHPRPLVQLQAQPPPQPEPRWQRAGRICCGVAPLAPSSVFLRKGWKSVVGMTG